MRNRMYDSVDIVTTSKRIEVFIMVFGTLYYREFPLGTSRKKIIETLDNEAPAFWRVYASRPK